MRTAIIGAGMVGLVAGLRLMEAGDEVAVFERADVPGGLAASFTPVPGGDAVELYYHHIFKSDRRLIALIEELGIDDRLFWTQPVTACLCGGRLSRLDTPLSLLRFSQLRIFDRLRLACALAALKLIPTAAPFERRYSARWLRAVAGTAAYRVVFEPLFRAKFAEHAEQISLAWFWARIHDRTAALGYLRGGFGVLYRELVSRIRDGGGSVTFCSETRAIRRVGSRFVIETASESPVARSTFDRVIATIPLHALVAMCPDFPSEFVNRYAPQHGLAARSVLLALDHPLTGIYWINVCDPGIPFMVVVEHTCLVNHGRYGGRHLVYLGNYGSAFPRIPTAALVAEFAPHLRRLNPAFSPSWIVDAWQFVAADAQPIMTPAYRDDLVPHATPLKRLYVANLSQVYPHDRGQNYAIALAESLVESLER